jgi:hypothetical protein
MAKIRRYLDRISTNRQAQFAAAFVLLCAAGLDQQVTDQLLATASLALALTTPPGSGPGTAQLA